MTYQAPHMRKSSNVWTTVSSSVKKAKNPKKKEYQEEFPSLNKELEALPRLSQVDVSKPSLSTLFKNSLNRKYKQKKQRIKPGWVLITANGTIDSLSKEERKRENDRYDEKIRLNHVNTLVREMDSRDNYQREYDPTYLWEWEKTRQEFKEYEELDEGSDYYSETDSDYYDDDCTDELDLLN